MYLVDYHCHTSYSMDSEADMEDMVKSAIKKGMKELCITDHFDYGSLDYIELDFLQYEADIRKLKEKYKDQIKVLFGLEVGVQEEQIPGIRKLLEGIPFDFKLASTHDVDNKGPHTDEYWDGVGRLEGYRKYYEGMYNSIKNYKDFDVFGHLDYVVRYGPYKDIGFTYAEIGDILDESMKELIHNGKGIELNTSAMRKGMNQFHPRDEIIKRYMELGGEIFTLGSDAHIPMHVGMDIDKAYERLAHLGAKYIATYDKRKLIMKKIEK